MSNALTITREERDGIWRAAIYVAEKPADHIRHALAKLDPTPVNERKSVTPSRSKLGADLERLAHGVELLDALGWEWHPPMETAQTYDLPANGEALLRLIYSTALGTLYDESIALHRFAIERRLHPGDWHKLGSERRECVDEDCEVIWIVQQIFDRHGLDLEPLDLDAELTCVVA